MKNRIIIAGITIVIVVAIIGLLNWASSSETKELISEYTCVQDSDCMARLPKGSCQWEIINKETSIQRDAADAARKTMNVVDIEVSCGGLVPIETFCRKGYCIGKMQYSEFYH